jgi:hypothetical protein
MIKVRVMEDGDSAGGNMNSGYECEVEGDEKISRSSAIALF